MLTREQLLSTVFKRDLSFRAEAIDTEARTVDVAFASEEPVTRWGMTEVLDCSPDAVDLSRLENSAPLLFNHNPGDYMGLVVNGSARVDGDRVCRATVLFNDDPVSEKRFQDVQKGFLTKISVGYRWQEYKLDTATANGMDTYRVTRWQPLEISFVTIPADDSVGVGRSLENGKSAAIVKADCQEIKGEKKMSERTETATLEVQRLLPEVEVMDFAKVVGVEAEAREYLIEEKNPTKDGLREFVKARKAASPAISVAAPQERTVVEFPLVRSKIFKDPKTAYQWGRWLCAVDGFESAQRYCRENGIPLTRAHQEKTNSKGGYLTPSQFLPELINLLDSYGVATMESRVIDMTSDLLEIGTVESGFTFHADSELGTIQESELGFGQIELHARKFSGFAKQSSELSEDAAISFFDTLTMEILRAAAFTYDDAFFNGTGLSAYNGILGVRSRLRNPQNATSDPTVSNVAGLYTGSGNAWSELTSSDFLALKAKLRKRFRMGAKWYVSPEFKEAVLLKLALAANGALTSDIINGNEVMKFLGAPVVEVEVMPATEANSQVCAIYGNLPMAAYLGRRREIAIATSEHVAFLNDALVTRATMRFDVNVFGVGNVDATAANQVTGPIVGLITAAS